jgi:hypothetical protein
MPETNTLLNLVANKFQPKSLSETKGDRDLARENVRISNQTNQLNNQKVAEDLAQKPLIQSLKAKALQGNALARLTLGALNTDEMIKIDNLTKSMNAQEREAKKQAAAQAAQIAYSELISTNDPERKKELSKIIAANAALAESSKLLNPDLSVQSNVNGKTVVVNKNPFTPEGVGITDTIGDTTSTKEPSQDNPFGSGITGRSQSILTDLIQKEKNGQQLSPIENMQKAFAIQNLTQERVQIRTDPETGEQFSVKIKPQLPPEIASLLGDNEPQSNAGKQKGTGIDVQSIGVGGGASKKVRQEAEITIRDLGRAKEKASELAEFVTKNPDVTGLRGLFERVKAGVGGQLGADVDTKAKDFMRKILLLKSDLRSLIDKGKFSDEDQKRLDALVEGIGILDDPKNTAKGFVELVKELSHQINKAKDILGEGKEIPKEIMDKVNEQAKINGWTDEEKKRAIDLLMGNK